MIDLNEIAKSLVEMDIAKTGELTKSAIDANIPADEILNKGLVAGLQVVGERFQEGEIFLPENERCRSVDYNTFGIQFFYTPGDVVDYSMCINSLHPA